MARPINPKRLHPCKRCGKITTNKVYCSLQCRYNISTKSIIDREMADEIIKLTKDGVPQQTIAKYMGINVKTIIRYKQNNPDFLRRLKKAKYNTDILAFKSVKAGMVKDWKAGRWWIKKRYAEQFGDQIKFDITNQPILIDDIMNEKKDESKRKQDKKRGKAQED